MIRSAPPMDRILVVEDDPGFARSLKRHLKDRFDVTLAESKTVAIECLRRESFDVVLTDVTLPDGSCFELLDETAFQSDPPTVIVMTADGTIDHSISAMQRGATDFLVKPFGLGALDRSLARGMAKRRGQASGSYDIRSLTRTPIADWRQQYAPEILGSDKALLRVFSIIERTADTDCSVLVTGESGTGKELVARAVHRASDRSDNPFITVNCAAIPENLLESELFGHVRGAFTGATTSREGRFQAAHGGTIFLDEIGEMPLALQSKLLRVLQEKEVTPVGESRSRKVDVRIVAATNRDLDEMVEEGRFREDLLYRLEVIPVELPALRERKGDIPVLVEHFVEKFNGRRGRTIVGLTDEAMSALVSYDWPGNIRQLQNAVERMVVLRGDGRLDIEDLPRRVRRGSKAKASPAVELPEEGIDLRDAIEDFENTLILQALERTGWNKNKAATILRMNRTTLVERLKKKKIERPIAV
ncbi:MAG: sigma-54 dependent transcriptional regulator [Myxococcota bacterium]